MKIRAGLQLAGNVGGALKDRREQRRARNSPEGLQQQTNKKGGDVILLSGCKDEQTSADAIINDSPSGALTYGLLHTLKTGGQSLSYEELLIGTRKVLKGKYSQIPQLCTGKEVNMKDQFIL